MSFIKNGLGRPSGIALYESLSYKDSFIFIKYDVDYILPEIYFRQIAEAFLEHEGFMVDKILYEKSSIITYDFTFSKWSNPSVVNIKSLKDIPYEFFIKLRELYTPSKQKSLDLLLEKLNIIDILE